MLSQNDDSMMMMSITPSAKPSKWNKKVFTCMMMGGSHEDDDDDHDEESPVRSNEGSSSVEEPCVNMCEPAVDVTAEQAVPLDTQSDGHAARTIPETRRSAAGHAARAIPETRRSALSGPIEEEGDSFGIRSSSSEEHRAASEDQPPVEGIDNRGLYKDSRLYT